MITRPSIYLTPPKGNIISILETAFQLKRKYKLKIEKDLNFNILQTLKIPLFQKTNVPAILS